MLGLGVGAWVGGWEGQVVAQALLSSPTPTPNLYPLPPSPSPNPNPSQVWLDPAATPQSVTVFEEAHGAGGGKGGAVCRSPLQHLTVEPG